MKLNLLHDKSDPWYADGLSFNCTCCGNCCTGGPGFVWMTDDEVERLAAHFGLSREKTLKAYCRKVGGKISLKEVLTKQGGYDCMFLKELPAEKIPGQVTLPRRVCGIYEARPLQCRTWPFWDGNLASRENWDAAGKRCPGMDSGKHYSRERIEALRDAPDWPDRPPNSGTVKQRRK